MKRGFLQLFEEDCQAIPVITKLKMKTMLTAYRGEVDRLREFAERKIVISDKEYDLQVFLLMSKNENYYETDVQVGGMN